MLLSWYALRGEATPPPAFFLKSTSLATYSLLFLFICIPSCFFWSLSLFRLYQQSWNLQTRYVRRWDVTKWSSSVLPFFFPGGSLRFLKNTIFQKSSRQWVRVPGHDMGPGIKYHTKKGQDFFSWKLPDVQRQEINFCLLWLRGGWSISLCM